MLEKAKVTIRKHFREIVIALIATLIWEVGKYLVVNLPATGKSLLKIIGDFPYERAAKAMSDGVIASIVGGLVAASVALSVIVLFTSVWTYVKAMRIPKPFPYVVKRVQKEESGEVKEKIVSDGFKLNEEIEKIKKETKARIWKGLLRLICLLICGYLLIVMFVIPAALNQMFKWHLDIIAPYTTEQTILQLKSDWARMTTKDDYAMISDTVGQIMDDNNLRN